MRAAAACLLSLPLPLLFAGADRAAAQAINPEVVYGRDYGFERMEASREVHDTQDNGTIRLVSFVYRPLKNDRHEAVIFSHGSTGGLMRSPREQGDAPPVPVIRYFISRGYTLVAPMRRGRGESSGAYVEECSVYVGQCTVPEQTRMATPALREALLDTNAVIDQLVLGKLVPKDSKMIAAGISRGGFLSLMLAAERPTQIKGVVNFVGGWLGITDRLAAADIKERMDLHQTLLTSAAQKTKVPTVWFYGPRDPFYTEGLPRQWFEIWQKAGGRGEFVFIDDPSLPIGHAIAPNINLWQKQVDAMLKSLEAVTQ